MIEIVGYEPENTTYRTIEKMNFGSYEYMYNLKYPHPEWQKIFESHKGFLSAANGTRDIDGLLNSFRFSRTFGKTPYELEAPTSGYGTIAFTNMKNKDEQWFAFAQGQSME